MLAAGEFICWLLLFVFFFFKLKKPLVFNVSKTIIMMARSKVIVGDVGCVCIKVGFPVAMETGTKCL